MIQLNNRTRTLLAAVGLLVVGGGAGAAIDHATRRVAVMAPVAPIRIAALAGLSKPWGSEPIAAVRGRVAELYGDRFVLDDGSGRVLVETGREGGDIPLAKGQAVTVQGRERDGVIRAMFLIGPDGRAYATGPGHGPGHRRDEHAGPDGGDPRGPSAPEPSHRPGSSSPPA